MTVADALMLALGAVAVGSGALVVTSTHLVRAGLYLVISLGAIAGLYLVLGAELVAWVQVLVYVGAVVVLMLFAVMLTRAPIGPSADLDRPAGPAALIGGGVGFGLSVLLIDAFRWTAYDLPPVGSARRVGEQIFGGWVLPFEVLSILLLAALVGAIILSRPDLAARTDAVEQAPVPPRDPAAESAETVARLTRIAARQATAEQRYREAAAEKAAADRRTAAEIEEVEGEIVEEPGRRRTPPGPGRFGPATPADLKQQASEVIFGAREGRPQPPGPAQPPAPPEASRVIEGTISSEEQTGGPAEQTGRPDKPTGGRAEQTGPGEEGGRPSRAAIAEGGRRRPELPPGRDGRADRTAPPAVEGAAERPSVAGPEQRPALPPAGRPADAEAPGDDAGDEA